MQVLHERCCGLDVHMKTVVACLLMRGPGGQPNKETRTFSTMTADLLAMADWLEHAGCTHVAMESTGSYWKPVYNLLEDRFQLLLVNAQHLKAVPGRKTDVKDAEWIAQLLRHGLVRGSFVPSRPKRELRELIRYRTSLIRERSAETNRIQKTLEGANIKLAAVAADVVGVSGRAMLEAMITGVDDPRVLASLAHGRMQKKSTALEAALEGRMSGHQRFLLAEQLRHIDDLDATIARLSAEIEERERPFAETAARLKTIPGIGSRTAELILAEIGLQIEPAPRLVIADVPREHSLVWTEQMMPVLPIVRVPDVEVAIDLAVKVEHGFRHTASIHSTNVETITRMARAMNCSIFVANAPNFAGLGEGGEGFCSFSIASPTGDGLTRPRTFSRERRITVVGALRIV